MATARAQLHAELVEILSGSGEDKKTALSTSIKRYRIQFKKSGQEATKTAREVVLENLLNILQTPPDDVMHAVANLLDDYRMQAKTTGSSRKRSSKKADAQNSATTSSAALAPSALPHDAPSAQPAAPTATIPEAVNPAARQRRARAAAKASRSECPKCHSMGVVLARSYATDEYYSCIYCGWQGFKPAESLEQEDSLAARLLGIYSGPPSDEGGES